MGGYGLSAGKKWANLYKSAGGLHKSLQLIEPVDKKCLCPFFSTSLQWATCCSKHLYNTEGYARVTDTALCLLGLLNCAPFAHLLCTSCMYPVRNDRTIRVLASWGCPTYTFVLWSVDMICPIFMTVLKVTA